MKTSSCWSRFTLCVLLLALAVAPAQAFDLIDSGIDIWVTRSSGATFIGFEENVLPADFFCSGSNPFAGKIAFRGVPVATFPQGALGRTDTIVQRLDEAVFDQDGIAVTRLQVRALQFEAVQPLRNECGTFNVRVSLDGEQPITEMRIVRENPNGGRFEAEVAVNARIVFTPIDHKGEMLEMTLEVRFPPRRNSLWAQRPGSDAVKAEGFVVVDTDFDGQPDTFVPGTSRNFTAGWPSKPVDADIFRRLQDPTQSEVSGTLLDGVNTAQLPQGLANMAEGLTACSINCHCEPSCGDHCLVSTCELCEIP